MVKSVEEFEKKFLALQLGSKNIEEIQELKKFISSLEIFSDDFKKVRNILKSNPPIAKDSKLLNFVAKLRIKKINSNRKKLDASTMWPIFSSVKFVSSDFDSIDSIKQVGDIKQAEEITLKQTVLVNIQNTLNKLESKHAKNLAHASNIINAKKTGFFRDEEIKKELEFLAKYASYQDFQFLIAEFHNLYNFIEKERLIRAINDNKNALFSANQKQQVIREIKAYQNLQEEALFSYNPPPQDNNNPKEELTSLIKKIEKDLENEDDIIEEKWEGQFNEIIKELKSNSINFTNKSFKKEELRNFRIDWENKIEEFCDKIRTHIIKKAIEFAKKRLKDDNFNYIELTNFLVKINNLDWESITYLDRKYQEIEILYIQGRGLYLQLSQELSNNIKAAEIFLLNPKTAESITNILLHSIGESIERMQTGLISNNNELKGLLDDLKKEEETFDDFTAALSSFNNYYAKSSESESYKFILQRLIYMGDDNLPKSKLIDLTEGTSDIKTTKFGSDLSYRFQHMARLAYEFYQKEQINRNAIRNCIYKILLTYSTDEEFKNLFLSLIKRIKSDGRYKAILLEETQFFFHRADCKENARKLFKFINSYNFVYQWNEVVLKNQNGPQTGEFEKGALFEDNLHIISTRINTLTDELDRLRQQEKEYQKILEFLPQSRSELEFLQDKLQSIKNQISNSNLKLNTLQLQLDSIKQELADNLQKRKKQRREIKDLAKLNFDPSIPYIRGRYDKFEIKQHLKSVAASNKSLPIQISEFIPIKYYLESQDLQKEIDEASYIKWDEDHKALGLDGEHRDTMFTIACVVEPSGKLQYSLIVAEERAVSRIFLSKQKIKDLDDQCYRNFQQISQIFSTDKINKLEDEIENKERDLKESSKINDNREEILGLREEIITLRQKIIALQQEDLNLEKRAKKAAINTFYEDIKNRIEQARKQVIIIDQDSVDYYSKEVKTTLPFKNNQRRQQNLQTLLNQAEPLTALSGLTIRRTIDDFGIETAIITAFIAQDENLQDNIAFLGVPGSSGLLMAVEFLNKKSADGERGEIKIHEGFYFDYNLNSKVMGKDSKEKELIKAAKKDCKYFNVKAIAAIKEKDTDNYKTSSAIMIEGRKYQRAVTVVAKDNSQKEVQSFYTNYHQAKKGWDILVSEPSYSSKKLPSKAISKSSSYKKENSWVVDDEVKILNQVIKLVDIALQPMQSCQTRQEMLFSCLEDIRDYFFNKLNNLNLYKDESNRIEQKFNQLCQLFQCLDGLDNLGKFNFLMSNQQWCDDSNNQASLIKFIQDYQREFNEYTKAQGLYDQKNKELWKLFYDLKNIDKKFINDEMIKSVPGYENDSVILKNIADKSYEILYKYEEGDKIKEKKIKFVSSPNPEFHVSDSNKRLKKASYEELDKLCKEFKNIAHEATRPILKYYPKNYCAPISAKPFFETVIRAC
jgi:hypothetical protein